MLLLLFAPELIGRKYPRRGKYGRIKQEEKINLSNLADAIADKEAQKAIFDAQESAKYQIELDNLKFNEIVAQKQEVTALQSLLKVQGLELKFDEIEQMMDAEQLVLLIALAMEE